MKHYIKRAEPRPAAGTSVPTQTHRSTLPHPGTSEHATHASARVTTSSPSVPAAPLARKPREATMSARMSSRTMRLLSSALLVAAVFGAAAAEPAAAEPACVSSATECTCTEHPPSGICTRSLDNGKCLDGECVDAMRCDCMGYEMCAINTCGKWAAVPPAVRSLTTEFQCTYDQNGSPCMSHTAFVDTVAASDNAQTAVVASVDETIEDQSEAVVALSSVITFQKDALAAVREMPEVPPNDNVTEEELEEVRADADETIAAMKDVSEGKCAPPSLCRVLQCRSGNTARAPVAAAALSATRRLV